MIFFHHYISCYIYYQKINCLRYFQELIVAYICRYMRDKEISEFKKSKTTYKKKYLYMSIKTKKT